jgi:hypothetical protein
MANRSEYLVIDLVMISSLKILFKSLTSNTKIKLLY